MHLENAPLPTCCSPRAVPGSEADAPMECTSRLSQPFRQVHGRQAAAPAEGVLSNLLQSRRQVTEARLLHLENA